jgi:hypothetical protein
MSDFTLSVFLSILSNFLQVRIIAAGPDIDNDDTDVAVTRPQQSPVTRPVVVLTKPSTQALTKPLPQKSTQKLTHDDSDSSSSSVMSVSTYENWDDSDGGSNVTEETDSQSCVDPINVKIRHVFNF